MISTPAAKKIKRMYTSLSLNSLYGLNANPFVWIKNLKLSRNSYEMKSKIQMNRSRMLHEN